MKRHSAAFYRRYVTEREPAWNEVEALIKESGGEPKRLPAVNLLRLAELYPEVCADLAFLRRELPSHRLGEHLSYLVGESYRLLYRPEEDSGKGFFSWLGSQLPKAVRAVQADLLAAVFLFCVAALVGYFLSLDRPGFGRLFVNPGMEAGLRSGELWTRSIFSTMPHSVLSTAIITNNITVTFAAFAGGILMGIGTLYILVLNGVMLGAVIAMCQHYGMAGPLFGFVSGHGFIEITAILIAGAAGLGLARAILVPGRMTRSKALQAAARNAAALLVFTCGILILAGLVEGFISPVEILPIALKGGLGLLLEGALIAVWLYLYNQKEEGPVFSNR